MAHIAQPCLAADCLTVELGVGVAGRGMRVLLAGLAMEDGAVVVLVAILRLEALVRRPGLDQRAVDRESGAQSRSVDPLGAFARFPVACDRLSMRDADAVATQEFRDFQVVLGLVLSDRPEVRPSRALQAA